MSGSIHVRFSPDQLRALNEWRRDQPDLPTKPQAIRDLVEEALAVRQAEAQADDGRREVAVA
jgi:hypothetical protein